MIALEHPYSSQDRQTHRPNNIGPISLKGHRTLSRASRLNGSSWFMTGTELGTGALELKDLKNLIIQIRQKKS
ncbi:MAG: hypothetical protein AB7T38_06330 [Nitrospirales bacterium]